jgi:C1A family cysteine protease
MTVVVECDLRHLFGPARDQGQRPTCMAFAASDTHAAVRPNWEPLSCEYAYYHALRYDGGTPNDGATLPGMMMAIAQDGQPYEAAWPYLSVLPSDLTQWKPPTTVGQLFRRVSEMRRRATELYALLDGGSPVIVAMTFSKAFYKPGPDGIVTGSEPIIPALRHAVIAVGHGRQGNARLVLVRNSWGDLWGINGYAWLTESYLAPRIFALAIMKEKI